ncbi:uncharacterized protein Gasu_63300 [Galdieria sulphuraria]|uniref:Uncharacterized protein n=1 Tax=Galdieria sulphuraria TaxID=130081 RepID=M2XRE9_GALSU|nr:uncharacterized protein Gasu_63300 [Galdieria sulphuraria]EME26014.1 hypothetical protein Gasu_63300 [Galdieria sulphuraria]|eukprot:XP_005702534.1 hypothetical protein Gasu_63300 [Galdieria sulphuraria]
MGKVGQFGKSGRFGMGPRNFDLKIAIMGMGGKWVGKGANWGQPQGDRDLKIAIVGGQFEQTAKVKGMLEIAIVVGWGRMGNWKWERVGKLQWGKMSGERGARKLEKRGQSKGDCVDLKIAIMDTGKIGTECELKILGESVQEGCLKNSNSKNKKD